MLSLWLIWGFIPKLCAATDLANFDEYACLKTDEVLISTAYGEYKAPFETWKRKIENNILRYIKKYVNLGISNNIDEETNKWANVGENNLIQICDSTNMQTWNLRYNEG